MLTAERRQAIPARVERDGRVVASERVLVGARVIVLDGGTTTLELARRLPLRYDGVVVTNSPPVASALANHPKAEVVLVGGRLLKDAQVAVGPAAVEVVAQLADIDHLVTDGSSDLTRPYAGAGIDVVAV